MDSGHAATRKEQPNGSKDEDNHGAGRRTARISPAEGAAKRSATRGAEIEGTTVHNWRTTTFASGKRRVYATFESVKTVGGMG